MNRAILAHRLHPVIDRVLPFEEAVQAYRYFRDGDPFGKVVVEL
jgi:NADPH:quinone reductase-like Zn-dependent oxidoreductase